MSSVLTYGHVRPDDNDTGATFWDQLRNNITQDDAHNHNGINSAILSSIAINPVSDTTSIVAANWIATSGGTYRMIVTTPPSISFDSYGMQFTITNGTDIGTRIYPTITKISNTTYYIYSNDNTINISVLYLV